MQFYSRLRIFISALVWCSSLSFAMSTTATGGEVKVIDFTASHAPSAKAEGEPIADVIYMPLPPVRQMPCASYLEHTQVIQASLEFILSKLEDLHLAERWSLGRAVTLDDLKDHASEVAQLIHDRFAHR